MTEQNKRHTYASTGVNYDLMDPVKRTAQLAARGTSENILDLGFSEVPASRGESAHVIDIGDSYLATVIEGLGTKNLVADAMRRNGSKRSYYDSLAQDTVAMIVNDLVVVGARPISVSAYWAVGSSEWFKDEQRYLELSQGWANACNQAEAVYAGGETPTLIGVINPDTIDLGGSAVGHINPKKRLTLGDKLAEGDQILLAPSSGIHANGLTAARGIADRIPEGYDTKLSDGNSYGEALLTPTTIYAKLVRELFNAGVDIHYMVNVTGHGWRKLLRANEDFRYVIDKIPVPHPVFDFIQQHNNVDDEEMYGNYNMGAGFALFVPEKDTTKAQQVAHDKQKMKLLPAGVVEKGAKEVIIRPKNISFKGDSLGVR